MNEKKVISNGMKNKKLKFILVIMFALFFISAGSKIAKAGYCGCSNGDPGNSDHFPIINGSGGNVADNNACVQKCTGLSAKYYNPDMVDYNSKWLQVPNSNLPPTTTIPPTTTTPPATTTPQNTTTAGAPIDFPNPVGANNLLDLVGNIMNGLRSVIVVVAIVFIVIGGIMYMSSAGSEKMIERAKSIIGGALIGLAITLAAPTFLKEIIKILGNPVGDPNAVVSNALTVYEIAVRALNFLLSVAGVLAIIGLVVGGVFYFTSYGDEERIEKGKKIISASFIGIAITLAAVLIVKQIMNLMGMS